MWQHKRWVFAIIFERTIRTQNCTNYNAAVTIEEGLGIVFKLQITISTNNCYLFNFTKDFTNYLKCKKMTNIMSFSF